MTQEDDHRDTPATPPGEPGGWAAPGRGPSTPPPPPEEHRPFPPSEQGRPGPLPPDQGEYRHGQGPAPQHPHPGQAAYGQYPAQGGQYPGQGGQYPDPAQGAQWWQPGHGPGHGASPYGGHPGHGAPPYGGQPGHGQQPPYGAPPPPKPGVVALRPMTLGDIFNGAFSLIRHNPKTTVGLSLIVMAVASILTTLASTWFLDDYTAWLDDLMVDPTAVNPDAPLFPTSPVTLVLMYAGELIVYLGGSVVLGLLATTIGMAVLGHRLTPRQAWEAGRDRLGAVIGLALIKLGIQFLMWIAATIGVVGAVVLGVIVGMESGGGAGFLVGLLLFLLVMAAVIVPGTWIWVRLYYAMPLVVLERLGPGRALARSWRLSQGQWWRTLGYWLLTGLLVMVVGMILNMPFGMASGVFTFIDSSATWTIIASSALIYVGTVLVYAITQPFAAGVNTLLYVDLRMRREGLDLRLHEAARAGHAVGPEIYLPEPRA